MKFNINKDKLEIMEPRIINSGSIAYYLINCEFDEKWNNLVKKAILIKKGESQGTEISVIDNQIYIDKQFYGDYFVGFVGYQLGNNEEKILQISTNLEGFYVDKGAAEITAVGTEITMATEWEIYIQQLQAIADVVSADKNIVIENAEYVKNTKDEVVKIKKDAEKIVADFNTNVEKQTNEFNSNAEDKKEEINEIAEGVKDTATAVQLLQFYVDDEMDIHGVTATKLSNIDLYYDEETGDFKEGVI